MSAFTLSSQILQRHASLFAGKHLLVAGDFHDDYLLQLATATTKVHCTLYHIYAQLHARRQHALIEFGLLPTADCYKQTDTLIYYWPKNKAEAQFQLACLLNNLAKGCRVFIVGENRSGVKSAETLLSEFGAVQKIDSARRCSLYHFQAESRVAFDLDEWWLHYALQFAQFDLNVCTLPGVFSQKSLDVGSELLLNSLLDYPQLIQGRIADIGCGCGVLSAFAAKLNPTIELVSADVSAAAIAATQQTLQLNHIQGTVLASDVFSAISGKFDLILSNPPFHDGKETNYNAAETLIKQSKTFLTRTGKLCLVANGFLPYHQLLAAHFKQVAVIAKTTRFKVYLAS